MSVCWVSGTHGSVPAGAILGGYDKDGGKIFVGRVHHESDLLPAKIVQNQGTSYVSYAGQEICIRDYEVMCHGSVAWACAREGDVPANAIPVGRTSDGETLYVGRAFHDGTLTVGKVHPSHGVCYIPYDGKEISCREYEILIEYR